MKLEHQFSEIRILITQAKDNSYKAVNTELISLYWSIGKYISEKINASEWGKGIISNLADYLQKTEPNSKGFSSQNLWRMKQFFESYNENSKLSPLAREISWSNNLMILSKSKTEEEKEFYLRLSSKEKLSKRELERQIDSGLFERVIISNEKLSPVVREIYPKAGEVFKNNYVLDFLALPTNFSEKTLRKSILENLKEFILEFGKDFTFVGEEYRVQVGLKDFYIDLLFYHRDLQCLVAIDLKVTDFKPEYLGKMEFYLEALDRDVKKQHEKPSVGIVLCKNKDEKVVEYSLSRSMSPTLVSKYQTELFDKKLLATKLDEFFKLAEKE
jgi:predicted nuclease of restriction endonuclease-like (RecB) superfamily